MITRMHYKQFAELLLRLRSALRSGSEPLQAVDQFEQELCLLLKEDNPLFAKERFLAASTTQQQGPDNVI